MGSHDGATAETAVDGYGTYGYGATGGGNPGPGNGGGPTMAVLGVETSQSVVDGDEYDPLIAPWVPKQGDAEDERTGTLSSSTFNLVNTIVGAGMLALPFATKNTGIVLGPLILLLTYGLVVLSCQLLITTSKYAIIKSYRGLACQSFGRKGEILSDVSVFVSCFGACTSYLVLIGDLASPLIAQILGGAPSDLCSAWADRKVPISFALLVVGPLSMLRNIDSLSYSSYLSVVSVLYLVIIVVVRSNESLNQGPHEDLTFVNLSEAVFRALPIMTLAFTCQMNIFSLLGALQKPTQRRVRVVVFSSLTICLVIYLIVGLFGYLTFYIEVAGNVLLNYNMDDPAIMVARVAVILVLLCSYPLLAHPAIDTLDGLFWYNKAPGGYTRRFFQVFGLVGVSYAIAMTVEDVSLVLGVAGSTGSTSLAFVLPSAFFLKLSESNNAWLRGSAWVLFVLGIAFGVISTVVTILDAVEEGDDLDLAAKCNRSLAGLI